jgi:predicted phosphodiesterase
VGKTHLVIPDTHTHYKQHNKRADLLAKLIIDLRPDRVIHLGDGPDMPSLSSYDKGKKSFQGRTYRADVDSWLEFQERMWKPVRRRKKRLPLSHYIEGNHDERIERVVQYQPELEGAVSFGDLELDKYWNEVTRYDGRTPGILVADGIHYSHYFVSGIMGKSISGERPAHALLTKQYVSCTQGHSHTLDYCVRTAANGHKIMGLSAGSFMDYRCDWAGNTQDLWWSGVVIKRNVEGGCYDPQFVSLKALQREYGR